MYENVEVNSHHVNKVITYTVLDDDAMQKLGFRKFKGNWIRFGTVKDDISLTVSFPVEGGTQDDLRIDILDEQFCQPYDYQSMLRKAAEGGYKPHGYALAVRDGVEAQMQFLQDAGVLSGHVYGEYI